MPVVFFSLDFLMEGIYNTDNSFDFTKLKLAKPQQIPGGNYFIRLSMDSKALYIQPPKSKTKQGFLKAGKRYYTDLMFSNEDTNFIEWMENLENYCQKMLFENRDYWFEDSMEIHDIENYFTSPLKIFKSGKYYIARVIVNTNLGKPLLKIYDEDENIIGMDQVNDKVNLMSILEIKGIKCSATSFQIEMDIKQMMVLKPNNLFEKCLFKTNHAPILNNITTPIDENTYSNVVSIENPLPESPLRDDMNETIDNDVDNTLTVDTENITNDENDTMIKLDDKNLMDDEPKCLEKDETIEKEDNTLETLDNNMIDSDFQKEKIEEENVKISEEQTDLVNESNSHEEVNELQEIEVSLDEIPEQNSFSIKNKDNVYYQMYKEAKSKAKVARDLAISSYLEAKRIKNLYMLDDTTDTDDSDFENIDEET